MALLPDQFDTSSLAYLEQVLRTALTAATTRDTVAGRVVVPLLGMAAAAGGAKLVAACCTPEPGRDARYEVRRPAEGTPAGMPAPAVALGDLTAAAALRAAIRLSRDRVAGVSVVGRTAAGIERCCLRSGNDATLEFLFPLVEHYKGADDEVRAVLGQWKQTFVDWGEQAGPPGIQSANHGAHESPPEDDQSPTTPADTPVDRLAAATSERPPSAVEIAEAIQFSLMQMTVDVNLTEMESLIRDTITQSVGALAPSLTPPPPPTPPPAIDQLVMSREIAALVIDRLSPLIARANGATLDRVLAAVVARLEPVVDDVQERLVQALLALEPEPERPPEPSLLPDRLPSPETEALMRSQYETRAALDEIAEVQAQLLAALSRQLSIEVRSAGAFERLDLQFQELREHTRASQVALQALTDQVAETTRRSDSSATRLLTNLGQELADLSNRIQRQLDVIETANKRTSNEASASAALRRLTTSLARGEAQAERIVQLLEATRANRRHLES